MERLFRGAAVVVAGQLGLALPNSASPEADSAHFLAWCARLGSDEDLTRDARMMVPVFYDEGRHKIKVWAFLGWMPRTALVHYTVPPKVLQCERIAGGSDGRERPEIVFASDCRTLVTPVMAEVYVTRLLDRNEFRRHRDRHCTREAILRNLP